MKGNNDQFYFPTKTNNVPRRAKRTTIEINKN